MADRIVATSAGGLAAAHQVACLAGLPDEIDRTVRVLRQHQPYHESDHVLAVAYNLLAGGTTIAELDRLRSDEALLDALGVDKLPAPSTAGDFCRRFEAADLDALAKAINTARLRVWRRAALAQREKTAIIDVDGTIVGTTGECKEGMALTHKRIWGYGPLIVSLANTAEPLFVVNRPGNTGAADQAPKYLDESIALVREAGFEDVLLRGDSAFSMTKFLDAWHDRGVRFVFAYQAAPNLKTKADELPDDEYETLVRQAKRALKRLPKTRYKQAFVEAKGYHDIHLDGEDIAEFEYSPRACKRAYRMIVLRKDLSHTKGTGGQREMWKDVRYFFYITNDKALSAEQVVFHSNRRCNQENLIAQLKSSRCLYAPVDTLLGNAAYMMIASLAWTLKAWMALSLPVSPRWRARHEEERRRWLTMEFRSFISTVIGLPAQVLESGRRIVVRFLSWSDQLHILCRMQATL